MAATGVEAALADEQLALDERQRLADALAFWVEDAVAGIAAMGLEALRQVPVRMLSTGQRKRAALARLISSQVPLWLLDEPANGLDADGLARLEAAMAARAGATTVEINSSHVAMMSHPSAVVSLIKAASRG